MNKKKMIIEHKYLNQKPVLPNVYNIDECIKIYDRYKNGFFSKLYDEEFSAEQCVTFARRLASFIVWSCFFYGHSYNGDAYVTLPGYHKIKGNVLTIYWNKIYNYWKLLQGRVWTRPLPIVGTVDDIVTYLH